MIKVIKDYFPLIIIVVVGLILMLAYNMNKDNPAAVSGGVATSSDSRITPIKRAAITTSKGVIEIEFFSEDAPKTVDNFVNLAKSGFYDLTKFHRVIKDFMIQGGDPLSKGDNRLVYGTGGPDYTFDDEVNDVKLVKGIVAMANRGPNTNGSQFFIITASGTPWLQGKHTPFARVVSGMDVVMSIGVVETDRNDIPVEAVTVQKIELK